MTVIALRRGSKVQYGGATVRVVGAVALDAVTVLTQQGEYLHAPLKDLVTEAAGVVKPTVAVDLKRQEKVQSYVDAFADLLAKPRHTKAEVGEAAAKLGISVTSAYDAIRRFRLSGSTADLPPPTRPGGRGKSRIDPKAEQIIKQSIEEILLQRRNFSIQAFLKEVKRRLRKADRQVSETTLRNRVANIPEHRWTKARKGYSETRRTHDPIVDHYPGVFRPLEAIQIDHWRADIEILSDDRLTVVGRPWITLAIDAYSRMVYGLHVGIDAPSVTTVGMAMINGMTQKDGVKELYGIDGELPVAGKPERVEADNAGEFTGRSMQASCTNFGIKLKLRPLGAPQYGAHIERLNGTLASRFKELPGATGASTTERKALRPTATAAFTLEDLTRHVWLMINEYQNEVHSAIGCTPLEKYKNYFFGPNGQKHSLPDVYVDDLEFRIQWFPLLTRTLQRYGIRIDHLDYYGEALEQLVRNRKNHGPLDIRRDPFDVRVIYVRHPTNGSWLRVLSRHLTFPVASIYELRAARREAVHRKRAPTPEILARIIDEQHRNIEESVKKTKTAQREATRKAHHDRLRRSSPSDAVDAPQSPRIQIVETTAAAGKTSSSPQRRPQAAPPTPLINIAAIVSKISEAELEAMFDD